MYYLTAAYDKCIPVDKFTDIVSTQEVVQVKVWASQSKVEINGCCQFSIGIKMEIKAKTDGEPGREVHSRSQQVTAQNMDQDTIMTIKPRL